MMVIAPATTASTRTAPRSAARGPGSVRHEGRSCATPSRPVRARPGGGPVRYPGVAVRMSKAPHGRQSGASRPITPVATVALALVAAAITVWLGLMAHFGAATAGGGAATAAAGAATARTGGTVPDRLSVVRVQDGETLQHLAARVAPDAPTGQVVNRIRELNRLDTVTLTAGQTLITPIG